MLSIDQHLFRLLDQREQEKMEWELLEGRVDGKPRAAPLSLSHGLVRCPLLWWLFRLHFTFVTFRLLDWFCSLVAIFLSGPMLAI